MVESTETLNLYKVFFNDKILLINDNHFINDNIII